MRVQISSAALCSASQFGTDPGAQRGSRRAAEHFFRACSSSGRAPLSHGGGTGFKSPQVHQWRNKPIGDGTRLESGRGYGPWGFDSLFLRWSVKQIGDCTWLEPGRGLGPWGFDSPTLRTSAVVSTPSSSPNKYSQEAGCTSSEKVDSLSLRKATTWWCRPALVPGTRLESERPERVWGFDSLRHRQLELELRDLGMSASGDAAGLSIR